MFKEIWKLLVREGVEVVGLDPHLDRLLTKKNKKFPILMKQSFAEEKYFFCDQNGPMLVEIIARGQLLQVLDPFGHKKYSQNMLKM